MFVRISSTDWADGGRAIEQFVILAGRLKDLDVDLIDVFFRRLVPKALSAGGKHTKFHSPGRSETRPES